jgi:hypothetical protein
MKRSGLGVVLAALFALVLAASSAMAANTIVLPRSGQVGISIVGQGGALLKTGDYGKEFGTGAGLAIRLRYRMRFERAMGLTFDMERMSSRERTGAETAFDSLTDAPVVLRDQLRLNSAGIEFYQLFDTRERTVRSISAGFGLTQANAKLTNGETQYPIAGDSIYLSAGAGLERFFFRSWAWDLGTHYRAVFHDGTINHDVQLHAGIVFYAAY